MDAGGIDVDALYKRYGPMVFRRCRGILRDDNEALDVMQDRFLAIAGRAGVEKEHQVVERHDASNLAAALWSAGGEYGSVIGFVGHGTAASEMGEPGAVGRAARRRCHCLDAWVRWGT